MSQTPPPPPPSQDPYSAQPPAYGGVPGQVPQQTGGSGLAIGALVLGVLALIFCWTVVGGIVLGLIALVLGIIASGRAKKGLATGRGMAITGVVLGILGALISVGIIVVTAVFLNSDSVKDLRDCVANATTQAERDQCQQKFSDDLQN